MIVNATRIQQEPAPRSDAQNERGVIQGENAGGDRPGAKNQIGKVGWLS